MLNELAPYRKFIVAAFGALLTLFMSMYPDTDLAHYAGMVLSLLTALGVYVIPNKTSEGKK